MSFIIYFVYVVNEVDYKVVCFVSYLILTSYITEDAVALEVVLAVFLA